MDDTTPNLGALLPGLLAMLGGDAGASDEAAPDAAAPEGGAEGASAGFDPGMLVGLLGAVGAMSHDSEEVRVLRTLRPLLPPERQTRLDDAIRVLRLAALLPLLEETGLLGGFRMPEGKQRGLILALLYILM